MVSKKIIILDDHTLFLKGMALLLHEYCNNCDILTYQSIKLLKKDRLDLAEFDLLISDIELPEEDTFEFLETLIEKAPTLPILVISMHKKSAIIRHCKDIGIKGYLLKDEDEQLFEAVESIISGGVYYSKTIQSFCRKTKETFIEISKREEQIIKLISKGVSNNDIATQLFISCETVKTHKRNIKLKLGMESTEEIMIYAKKNYLI